MEIAALLLSHILKKADLTLLYIQIARVLGEISNTYKYQCIIKHFFLKKRAY